MYSVLTVVTPSPTADLTTLATLKAELGITDASEDANLAVWITQASAACATYCKRVFGLETLRETFRGRIDVRVDSIMLGRSPVTSIASVVEDTVTLVQDTDFWLDPTEGIIYRLDGTGNMCRWQFRQLVVNFTAGYNLLGGLPYNVERACLTQVQAVRASAGRDPQVKQESIPGVLETSYWTATRTDDGALEPEVTALLDPFRHITV